MTRRPTFWIVFAALGIAGAVTALRLFTVALPVVSLDIEMDREGAIARAAELAEANGWGPADARSAASFGQVDSEVQTYVELEGGGSGAFQDLMDVGAYQPYQWRVRRFAEGRVEETEVRFTPGGEPYGFQLRLAEDDPGDGNVDDAAARALTEREATAWPVDLSSYDLIESSSRTQPGGRVDHTLVYERGDVNVADARFRLRLVVAGDRLAELTHFAFVPEAFSQRYADMRATNDAIALVAQSFFLMFYVILGAGVGTALLLRAGWVRWRTALVWGAIAALLFGLNTINALPLAWMGYDTALSAGTFVVRNVASAGAIALLGAPILAFFFLAAESLGRRAFPEHLQQWRFWSAEVAASKPALGLTVAAYLLVGIQLGYVVLFYLGTSRLEGWWSPADALVQPDLLATYVPWLQAVSLALFAGLWEESIFRAVPIACAALIGARLGRRSLWIWGMVVLQALVFAAGHANYPQQPPYARVVELTLPALVWGAVYVRFGLVPTILAHFLYDLSLISSVLFASEARIDQGVIVLVGAIPLAVVLWARRGGRGTDRPPEWGYNRAFQPDDRTPAIDESAPGAIDGVRPDAGMSAVPATAPGRADMPRGADTPDGVDMSGGVDGPADMSSPGGVDTGTHAAEPAPRASGIASPTMRVSARLVAVAALVGMASWLASLTLAEAPPRLELTRGEAIELATDEVTRLGYDVRGWTPSAMARDARGPAHEFVLDQGGPESYHALMGTFLAPPQWIVRFVDWRAPPEERVEEYLVNIGPDGDVRRVAHTLPESRPGARLDEDSARTLVRAELPPGSWEEVGAQETTHSDRTDWTFVFRSPDVLTGVAGEGRAYVTVLGDEVTDVRRSIQVPEQWEREQRQQDSRRTMVSIGLAFALALLFGAGAVTAIVVWSRHRLVTGPLWRTAALVVVAMGLSLANNWPDTTGSFSTTQPWLFQVIAAAIGFVLVLIVASMAVGLVAALGHSWAWAAHPTRDTGATAPGPLGVTLGLLVAGLFGLVGDLARGLPRLPDYSGAGALIPVLAAPLDTVLPLALATSALLALAAAHRRFADRPVLHSITSFALVAIGIVLVPSALQGSIVTWIAAATIAASAVWALARIVASIPAVAPALVATFVVTGQVESALRRPYPGSFAGALLAVVVAAVVGWVWSQALRGVSGARPAGRDVERGPAISGRSGAG